MMRIFVFFAAAFAACVSTIIFSRYGSAAPWVWAVTVTLIFAVAASDAWRKEWRAMALGAGFTAGFFALFIKSTDVPLGASATAIAKSAVPALLGIGALLLLIAFWRAPRSAVWTAGLVFGGWVVAMLSSSKGGPDPMLQLFAGWFGPEAAETAVMLTRKGIHFTFYGMMGFAAYRAGGMRALVYPVSLAMFDEFRQATSLGRTGSWLDVLLDLAGVATFVYLARYSSKRKHDALAGSA